jgi:hypothetical protein
LQATKALDWILLHDRYANARRRHPKREVANVNTTQGLKQGPKGVTSMGLLRTGLAGAGAWKWGGGLFGTIVVFIVLYWLLGAVGMQ